MRKSWVNETSEQGEDLNLLESGETSLGQIIPKGRIFAAGSVELRVGDKIATPSNSEIIAGTTVTLRLDYQNADAGFGGVLNLQGQITSGSGIGDRIQIFGNRDADIFTFNQAFLKGQTNVYGGASVTTGTDDGEDLFIVNQLQSMTTSRGGKRDTLNLDGQADTDNYIINTTGSQGDRRDYIINVLDTGAKDDGVDTLSINGTDSSNDILLLRGMTAIPGETADSPAFVALVHSTLAQAQTPSDQASIRPQEVQRVNYDANINGRLNVYGLGGNDFFASDDNSAITTLDGGAGNDQFQIGQLFGSDRTSAIGNLAVSDVFDTVRTTRGFLSRGNSFATVAQGGTGDDTFSVYSNQAELRLEGDAGNDQFVIRAFALADANGNPLLGNLSTNGNVNVKTGSGDDQVQYNINAPVSIDGGTGFDKVVVLGTEFADNFVISEDGIFGAGVNVKFNSVEVLEIDGLEGDATTGITDTYTVQLTKPPAAGKTVTVTLANDGEIALSAANPSDTRFSAATKSITFNETNWNTPFTVKVAATQDVALEDAKISVITHKVTSTDSTFVVSDATLDVEVLDDETPGVLVTETDGSTLLIKGDGTAANPGVGDSYTVRLTKAPVGQVTINPVTDGQATTTPASLTFNQTNWFQPQTVNVSANPSFVPVPKRRGHGGYLLLLMSCRWKPLTPQQAVTTLLTPEAIAILFSVVLVMTPSMLVKVITSSLVIMVKSFLPMG